MVAHADSGGIDGGSFRFVFFFRVIFFIVYLKDCRCEFVLETVTVAVNTWVCERDRAGRGDAGRGDFLCADDTHRYRSTLENDAQRKLCVEIESKNLRMEKIGKQTRDDGRRKLCIDDYGGAIDEQRFQRDVTEA